MSIPRLACVSVLASVMWCPIMTGNVCAQQPTSIILDTELGTDIDDAIALGVAAASPLLDLRGVTTVSGNSKDRAWMACRFLTAIGKKTIPVSCGGPMQPEQAIDWQIQYRRHPAVIFNRTSRPEKQTAVSFLREMLKSQSAKTTIIATGPLTNIARLLKSHPKSKSSIQRLIVSAGSDGAVSSNLQMDLPAAKAVLTSGVPLTIIPSDPVGKLKLPAKQRRKIFAACTPLTFQIQALYQLWDKEEDPGLADALAVALAGPQRFCKRKKVRVVIDKDGRLKVVPGNSNAELVSNVDSDAFLHWCVATLSSADAVLPQDPPNVSKLIPEDNMPNRVHAFEDYETDIEKRWWMSGKLETKNVPPRSRRACRGVLTQDFDARMGNLKTMYTAVIFNPVPGPPMGKQPRLRFRFWLKGADTLRVQIYSLSNGYHRCLTLKNLPQQQWQWATADMTKARRPDGSGGPLSENERIDDIQFYTDPRAELIIDDIVLYDAPAAGEKKPFPRSLLFTGWFDTGKQGREWPGDFSIDKDGYFRRAAKSNTGKNRSGVIRLNLRGPRPVGKKTALTFRYFVAGTDRMTVKLVNRKAKRSLSVVLTGMTTRQWQQATIDFSAVQAKNRPAGIGNFIDEVVFGLPKNAELKVDDLLLYTPGE